MATNEDVEERIAGQAEWLADVTAMSERQAETFVRDTLRGDAPQHQIASMMGIGESTVSNHLSAANDATGKPTSAIPYWLFFGPGPLDPAAYKMTPVWTGGGSEWLVVFENRFPTYTNPHAPRFYAVHHYPDRGNNGELSDEAQSKMADARIRHVTDRYEFDSLDAMQSGLPEAVEFDSDRKRERFMEMFNAHCEALRSDEMEV